MPAIVDGAEGKPDGVLYGWGPWHTTATVLRPLFDLDRLPAVNDATLAAVADRLR